jgi:autotransporter-associated beta strand protein
MTGGGLLQKVGNGTVTLPTANTGFTGQTLIDAGAVRVASFGALGSGNASVTVAAGAQLDIGGLTAENIANGFAAKPFFIAGAGPDGSGALVNKGGPQQFNAFQQVTLTADATVGGIDTGGGTSASGRLDLRNNSPQLDLAGFTLTKTGNNLFGLVGVNVTDGNIVVNNGTLGIETTSTIADNSSGKSITYNAGPGITTTAWFYNLSGNVTRPMFFNSTGGGSIIIAVASPQNATVGSNMTLSGPATFTSVNNGTGALILNGNIQGDATSTITKSGPVTVTFGGNVNYGGPTNIVAGVLAFNGTGDSTIANVNGVAAATLLKQNTGSLTVNYVRVGNMDVSDGQVIVAPNSGPNGVSKVASVSIGANAKLDLKDNKLITNTLPGSATAFVYNGLQGEVQRASNSGSWDQPGLTTSMPDAQAGLTTIGISTGEARGGLGPTDTDLFAGQTITGASTIAMYTYAGDANLDGLIDGGDYGIIDNFVQVPGADSYFNGDFNYDGVIDGGDYGIIDNNIQAQGAPFPTSGSVGLSGVTAVPEPTACGLAILTAATLLGRRRRRTCFSA